MKKVMSRVLAVIICLAMVMESQAVNILAKEIDGLTDNEVVIDDIGIVHENNTGISEERQKSEEDLVSNNIEELPDNIFTTDNIIEESNNAISDNIVSYEGTILTSDTLENPEGSSLDGNGTEESPYIIKTPADLATMADDLTAYYELGNDINLDAYDKEWIPIKAFNGHFNGNYHKIYNLSKGTIWASVYNATIENLCIIATTNTTVNSSGLLCNRAEQSTIKRCFVAGNISGGSLLVQQASGIISECQVQGRIISSSNTSIATGDTGSAGGIVREACGELDISDCAVFSEIKVNGYGSKVYTGGICGLGGLSFDRYVKVKNCLFKGELTSPDNTSKGGIVGSYAKEILNCYFLAQEGVSDSNSVRGINITQLRQRSTYSNWDFSNVWELHEKNAGLPMLKWLRNVDTNLFDDQIRPTCTGFSEASNQIMFSNHLELNLEYDRPISIVENNGIYFKDVANNTIISCYYELNGTNSVYVKTQDDMIRGHSYRLVINDSIKDVLYNNLCTSGMNESKFQVKISNIYFDGDGTEANPFKISTVEQLNNIYLQPSKCYVLMNDLDLSVLSEVNSIGEKKNAAYNSSVFEKGGMADPFTGVFDGDGYTLRGIKNFSGNNIGGNTYNSYVALFASTKNATIKNLNIELADDFHKYNVRTGNSTSISYWPCVAGIVACGSGTISQCSVIGSLYTGQVSSYVGLIAGDFSGEITKCYACGEINGINSGIVGTTGCVGGLVGYLRGGVISDCYSWTSVKGAKTGGLVGNNDGLIERTYSVGEVVGSENMVGGLVGKNTGSVVDSYYCNDISGQNDDDGRGEPKSSEDLKKAETYVNYNFSTIWELLDDDYATLISFDHYYLTYGLSARDLFYKCPEYLNKGYFNNLEARLINAAIEAENDVSDSQIWSAAFFTSLKKGSYYCLNEIGSWFGIREKEYDNYKEEMTLELIREFTGISNYKKWIDKISKQWKETKTYINLTELATKEGFIRQIAQCSTLDEKRAEDLVNKLINPELGYANKILSVTGDSMETASVIAGLVMFYEIEIGTLQDLKEIEKEAGESELTEEIEKLIEDRTQNPVDYILKTYGTSNAINNIGKAVKSWGFSKLKISSMAVSLGSIACGLLCDAYEHTNPKASDIVQAAVLHNYWNTSERTCNMYIRKFITNSESEGDAQRFLGKEEYIRRFEIAYNFKLTCMKLWMEKAKGCTDDELVKKRLNWNSEIGSNITYDKYIESCIKAAVEDINEGKLIITQSGAIKKTVDGTIIDENYDSSNSIKARLQSIKSKYEPGRVWTDNWDGCIQSFGFARMVFSKIFDCDMPYTYYSDKPYMLVDNGNVVEIGLLQGKEVTTKSIKDLLLQGKPGDIIQAFGNPYGQHTMIFLYATNNSVRVYDCNSAINSNRVNSCVINEWDIPFDSLSYWYGTGDVCGIALYRASNYAKVCEYSIDSFDGNSDFQISDGVLKKYNGNQESVYIPNTVISIGKEAFLNNDAVQYINIPDSVVSIEDGAFEGCTSLMKVELPNSIISIYEKAFYMCESLMSIEIPPSVTNISPNAFSNETRIYGIKGSYIETYATENNLSFWGKDEIPITSILLSRNSIEVGTGETVTLKVKLVPENNTDDTTILWETNNPSVATVDNGLIKGVSEGKAVIKATIGSLSAKCTVTVVRKMTSLSASPDNIVLYVGQEESTYFYSNIGLIPEDKLKIENSNPSIVSYTAYPHNGLIKIKGLNGGADVFLDTHTYPPSVF